MGGNMSNISVIDSSYILKYLLKDEHNSQVDSKILEFREQKEQLVAPELLGYEVANAIRSAVMRNRITQKEAEISMCVFTDLEIELFSVDLHQILRVACKHGISCYDASYIALAREKNAKLLTYDTRLIALI